MAKQRQTVPPEAILAETPQHLVEIAHRLRDLIKSVVPEVIEAGYPGWRLIGYRGGPGSKYFGFIAPALDAEEIRLGFEHGASLPDPAGLLHGNGKQVRYVPLRQMDEVAANHADLIALIEAAAFRTGG